MHRILLDLSTDFRGPRACVVVCLLLDCCRGIGDEGLPTDAVPAPPSGCVCARTRSPWQWGSLPHYSPSSCVPPPPNSIGFLVGYATATGREAWAGEDSSQYTTALLCSMRASAPLDTMSCVLRAANAAVPAHGESGQRPVTNDSLGPLGPVAVFHGVHGLLPVSVSATGSSSPVRVADVAGKLLDAFQKKVCVSQCMQLPQTRSLRHGGLCTDAMFDVYVAARPCPTPGGQS